MNIKVDDVIEVDIIDIGESGEGVGKYEGLDVFVDGAVLGETVTTRIINVNKKYLIGRLKDVITPSLIRTKVNCDIANKCGGCQIQQIKYREQLALKEHRLKCIFEETELDCFKNIDYEPIVGMETPVNYRSKGVYQVGLEAGKLAIGFYKKRSHQIIDTDKCIMQDVRAEKIINIIRNVIIKNNISVYDEVKKKGILRKIVIRTGIKTGEIMVCLVINGIRIPDLTGLVNNLQYIEGLKSVVINVNMEMATRILSSKDIVIWGDDHILDYIGDIKYKITPLSIFPINPIQTEKQHQKILEYADLNGDELVWDAYCRTGTIALMMAKKARRVIGVEKIKKAVIDATINAEENNLDNIDFYNGRTEKITPAYFKKNNEKLDVLILYPPSKGCDHKLLHEIPHIKPDKVIYISYSPESMVKDLEYLIKNGYYLEKIQPMDILPHTMHVESVVKLVRIQ